MKCSNCKEDLAPDDKFCGECGTPVVIDDHQDKLIECPKCHKLQKKGKKYCSKCAQPINVTSERTQEETPKNNNAKSVDELDGNKEMSVIASVPEPDIIKKETTTAVNSGDSQGSKKVGESDSDIPNKQNNNPQRGFAVVSVHNKFQSRFNLSERPSAFDDLGMLETVLTKHYECKVLPLSEKKGKYYDEDLCKDIEKKMNGENYQYFIFALSSHGDEKEEVEKSGQHTFQHYFYTYDGQYHTQQLIDKISELECVKDKLKIFIIQACRSRVNHTDVENMDIGATVEVLLPDPVKVPSTDDHSVVKDDVLEQSKSQSIDVEDARGYMPPPEDDEEMQQPSTPMQMTILEGEKNTCTSSLEEVTEAAQQSTEVIITRERKEVELIPVTAIPQCDDAVMVFASMSGKYAYSKQYDPHAGGWLIKAFSDILDERSSEDKVHILDVLTNVNRIVSQRDALLALCTPNHVLRYLNILYEDVRLYPKKDSSSKLREEINNMIQLVTTKLDARSLEDDLFKNAMDLIRRVEKIIGFTGVKAQSCFFHNLALNEDRDYHMKYVEEN